ncbi:MAG: ABC transporter permease [Spirochaetes bacterium]|nr:ABC transporter permease [Spirochaetota bacterium]
METSKRLKKGLLPEGGSRSGLRKTGGCVDLLLVAYRNLYRNKRRTILCMVAVGLAVFFNIFMQSWIDGMYTSIEDVVQTFETGHLQLVSKGFEGEKEYLPTQFPLAEGEPVEELVDRIQALPRVKAVLPRIVTYASLFDSVVKHGVLWGVDIERELATHPLNLTTRSNGLKEGRYPRLGENACAVGTTFARKTGIRIGDRIPFKVVSAQFSDKFWNPEVVGIFQFDYRKYDEGVILVPFDRLQKILLLGEGTQQVYVYLDNGKHAEEVKQQIQTFLGEGAVIHSWTENYWIAYLRNSTFLYVIIFGVFQIVASFLIINTVVMVIHERIKEIGMMGALGMTRREIVQVFFFEAVFLSVFGALAGSIFGGMVSWVGSLFPLDMEMFTGGGMKEFPITGTLILTFSLTILGKGFLFGVGVSALCTLIPSLKSAFIEPVEALRR